MFRIRTLASFCCLGLAASVAQADVTIALGGGWEAVIFQENLVDLAVDYVSIEDDVLVIEKFANFASIDPFTGQPDPIRIAFNQVGTDAETVSRIVIADELVANNTGFDFYQFEMVLLGAQATWDQAGSAGFSINPFTEMDFIGDQNVLFSGGTVEDGTFWTPGELTGELIIDIDLSNTTPSTFILKEIAMVPAPAAVALLGLAGLSTRRRRRN